LFRQAFEKIAVDRVDDLQMPGQQALDQGDRPGSSASGSNV